MVIALLAVWPLVLAWTQHPSPHTDIDSIGYAWLFAFACLPVAALFGLAATAHWRQWPLRWFLQGLAIALPMFLMVFFILG